MRGNESEAKVVSSKGSEKTASGIAFQARTPILSIPGQVVTDISSVATDFLVTKTAIVCAICAVFALGACKPKRTQAPEPYEFDTYVLFTWNTSSTDFCFKIMTRAESNEYIHTWFPRRGARCGIAELRQRLASLRKGAFVEWQTWPPQGFDYPADSVVQEMIEFAKGEGIRLEQSPALR